MTDPAIRLTDVSMDFETAEGPVHALDRVSFTCNRGSSVAVVGRSGSGKSTLMSILALLRRPTSGDVVIDGIDSASLTENERSRVRAEHVGIVFQSFHLEPSLTALENVLLPWRFAPSMATVGRRDARRHATTILDTLGIADLAGRTISAMSGGQRQRVAIARALIARPTVVVADEPTGNLDEETADAVASVLLDLPATHGTAVVVVTHDPAVAARADRAVTLTHGRVAVAAA